jgi:hypothetical protein
MHGEQTPNDDLGLQLQRGGVLGSTESLYDVEGLLNELGYDYETHGNNLQISCPTAGHEDANPSASIHSENGLWLCFSCSARGDILSFLAHQGLRKPLPILGRHRLDARAAGNGGDRQPGRAATTGWAPYEPTGYQASPSLSHAEYVYRRPSRQSRHLGARLPRRRQRRGLVLGATLRRHWTQASPQEHAQAARRPLRVRLQVPRSQEGTGRPQGPLLVPPISADRARHLRIQPRREQCQH